MSAKHLRNISLNEFERFLEKQGCKCIRQKGGHRHWARKDLMRPVTVKTHITPVPEFIIRNCLRTLRMSKEDFLKKLNEI